MPVLAFKLHYWLARRVGSKQTVRQAVSRPALRRHTAAAAKLRVALCWHSPLPQEDATQWLTGLIQQFTLWLVRSTSHQKCFCFRQSWVSNVCTVKACQQPTELCSSARKLQTRKEAHYKQSKTPKLSTTLYLKGCRSKDGCVFCFIRLIYHGPARSYLITVKANSWLWKQ